MYRIYTLSDGHFVGIEEYECASDTEAVTYACGVLGDRVLEVWRRGRFIARLGSQGRQTLRASA